MVVGPFPVVKLGALVLKTLSKPVANSIKERAKKSQFFRKYVCLPPAQFYNWCEIKTKMWILNLGQPVQVPPLNEAAAIELGGNMLGELVVLVIGAALLIYEYRRQSVKQAAKEEEEKEEKQQLETTIRDLSIQVATQQVQLRELFRHVHDLESRVVKLPFSRGQKPVEEDIPVPQNINPKPGVIINAVSLNLADILGYQS